MSQITQLRPFEEELTPEKAATETERLRRQEWHYWLLLLGTLLATTVGLGFSVMSLLASRDQEIWPWPGSQYVLLGGLSLMVALFGFHLTRRTRQVASLQKEVLWAREKVARNTGRHYNRLMAICQMSQAMASETDPNAVLQSIIRIAYDFFGCERVSLMLLDRQNNELVVHVAIGFHESEPVIGARRPVGEGVAGWVAKHQEPLILGPDVDPSRYRDFQPNPFGLTAALVTPIVIRNELVGVLNLSSEAPGASFDQEDLQALQVFAWNSGICIRHAQQAAPGVHARVGPTGNRGVGTGPLHLVTVSPRKTDAGPRAEPAPVAATTVQAVVSGPSTGAARRNRRKARREARRHRIDKRVS